jgi:hypothetical protein
MVISAQCPSCGRLARVERELEGRRVKCPVCKRPFVVAVSADRPARGARPTAPPGDAGPEEAVSVSTRRRPPRPRDEDDGDDERGRDDADDRDGPLDPDGTPSRRPAVLIAGLAAGAALLLGVGGVATYLLTRPAPQPITPPAQPLVATPQPPGVQDRRPPDAQQTVEAPRLLNAYLSSDASATEAYTGKMLDVRGVVAGTRRDASNRLVVGLDGTEPRGLGVLCVMLETYESKAAGLRRGQAVTIRGRCDGKGPIIDPVDRAANVLVADAHLIEVRPEQRPPEPAWVEPPATASHDNVHLAVKAVEWGRVALHEPQGVKYVGNGRIQEAGAGGRVALSSGKYLAIRLELTNASGHQVLYYHPAPAAIRLADESGNVFRPVRDVQVAKEVAPPGDSPLAREQLFVLGMRQAALMHDRDKALDVLLFDAANLGKGKRLLLELPGAVFANHLPGGVGPAAGPPPARVLFRIDQPGVSAFVPPAFDAKDLRGMTSTVFTRANREGDAAARFLAAKAVSLEAGKFAASFEGQLVAIGLAQRLAVEPEDAVRAAVAEALGEVGGAALRVYNAPRAKAGDKGAASVVYGAASRGVSAARSDPSPGVRAAVAAAMVKCGLKK